jgi:NtrC-family two-component system response regulator AlgB
MPLTLLFVGDERKNRRLLNWGLRSENCEVFMASSRASVSTLLDKHAFHAACLDTRLEDDDAMAVLAQLRRRMPKLPVIALLADRDRRRIAELRALAVHTHLVAPFSVEALRGAIDAEALAEPVSGMPPAKAAAPALHATLPAAPAAAAPKLVARDEVARRMLEIALRAAPSNVAILILGETGTGKNLLAQTIHEQSPLRAKPFVTVSCPSLNRELLESDLFGHVRGAFTGAVQDTWGKVAAAEGGTLFLDEIGDLPPQLQPKLLRLLQEKQYERVGETTPRTANVRIIAATNRDLKAEVAAGRFREDLFYRLNVITLEVPPLRCRPSDIMAAAEVFLDTICRQLGKTCPLIAPEARRLLESYAWPGNLRELRNVVERAAVLSDAPSLDVNDFPSLLSQHAVPQYQVGAPISLQALETAHIQMVVAKTATLEEAARILEIDKSTLYRKRKAMGSSVSNVTQFRPAEENVATAGR